MALPEPLTNVLFPTRSTESNSPNLSMVATRATVLDVCYSVYGESTVSTDAVDNFYETSASKSSGNLERNGNHDSPHSSVSSCHSDPHLKPNRWHVTSSYENPFITATSRSVISDIHRLSRQLSSIDVPRPLAMMCTLFRLRPPNLGQNSSDALFTALRVWTDVEDICESEFFGALENKCSKLYTHDLERTDGHRKAIVEHTLNILLLPGIHCESAISHRARASTDSLLNIHSSPMMTSNPHFFATPSLPIPGTSLSFPSPLHLQLRIITRLSFNEQGLVTYHRDIWDVKDLMGLLPGMTLAQWLGTRIAAVGLSYISKFLPDKDDPKCSRDSARRSLEVADLERVAWQPLIISKRQRSNCQNNFKGRGRVGPHLTQQRFETDCFLVASPMAWLLFLLWTSYDSPQRFDRRDHMACFYQIRWIRVAGLVDYTIAEWRRLPFTWRAPWP